jgi:hypothetical protein
VLSLNFPKLHLGNFVRKIRSTTGISSCRLLAGERFPFGVCSSHPCHFLISYFDLRKCEKVLDVPAGDFICLILAFSPRPINRDHSCARAHVRHYFTLHTHTYRPRDYFVGVRVHSGQHVRILFTTNDLSIHDHKWQDYLSQLPSGEPKPSLSYLVLCDSHWLVSSLVVSLQGKRQGATLPRVFGVLPAQERLREPTNAMCSASWGFGSMASLTMLPLPWLVARPILTSVDH